MLIRRCSPYTQRDIIIGLYSNREKAENAKKEYIRVGDERYTQQVYHDVNLDVDLAIKDIKGEFSGKVFILIYYCDFMGQIDTQQVYFTNSFVDLNEEKINRETSQENKFYGRYEWDALVLDDSIRFDNEINNF
jgi:hypothetical protein